MPTSNFSRNEHQQFFLPFHEPAVDRADKSLRRRSTSPGKISLRILEHVVRFAKMVSHVLQHDPSFARVVTELIHHSFTGSKQRESAVNAVPLSSGAGSRSRNSRYCTYAPTKGHHADRLNTDRRKMAWPSAERNLAQSDKNPRPQSKRLSDSRSQ